MGPSCLFGRGGAEAFVVNYGRTMTMYGVRTRVACYVTRSTDGGSQLLVFARLADQAADLSGVRIPAGGMARFEAIEAVALREVAEESGLTGLRFERQLGAVELGLHDPGGPSITTYVHLTAPNGGHESWQHTVSGEGDDSGMTYVWRWEPLPLAFELAAGEAAYLDLIST